MKDDSLTRAIDAVSLTQIINDFTPTPDTARLGERGGAIRDPRPGHSEHRPSFSVFQHEGRQLYKRHGSDGATGNAYQYLTDELGMSPADAALEIKRRAGFETGNPSNVRSRNTRNSRPRRIVSQGHGLCLNSSGAALTSRPCDVSGLAWGGMSRWSSLSPRRIVR